MKNLKKLLITAFCGGLLACGGGGGGSSGGGGGGDPTPTPTTSPTASSAVIIGNVTPIPVIDGVAVPIVPMVIINGSTSPLTLISAKLAGTGITGNNTNGMLSNNLYVDTSACTTLVSQCNVILKGYGLNQNMTYVITFVFEDAANNHLTSSQLVTYSNNVPTVSGSDGILMALSSTNNNLFKFPLQNTAVTIPFILGSSYSTLAASSVIPSVATDLVCTNNVYIVGNTCYIIAQMSNIGTTPFYLGDILLEGTNEIPSSFVASMVAQGTTKAQINSTAPSSSTSIPITVAQTNVGNLILSAYNVVINPANGTTPITLEN